MWIVSPPFEVQPSMAEINASESFEFVLAFHPREATSYAQKAILRCGDLTYETKASEDVLLSAAKSTDSFAEQICGVGKYAAFKLDAKCVDFGEVTVRGVAKRTVRITNGGRVEADVYAESNRPFSLFYIQPKR